MKLSYSRIANYYNIYLKAEEKFENLTKTFYEPQESKYFIYELSF